MTAPLISIQDLSISFITEDNVNNALQHISFEVKQGEIVALVGESGSGKSVTSLSILRLLPSPPAVVNSGQILLAKMVIIHPIYCA
ncbi:ATP-binding cassette domain-containing protein [Niabella hibiscisoli]|uniref:ATP-binding cassette domain-containing protein n=1 Tax=Niabella hibiscisoli TaxID=1825928 RepID=UPI0021D4862E|nr:ATP-binding cassette domain-containing protein [Niabella hibiscisoli]